MRHPRHEDLDRAQRLSDFVDSLVIQQRVSGDSTTGGEPDGELDDLSQLAADLSAIALTPPAGFRERLRRRLGDGHRPDDARPRLAGFMLVRALQAGLRPAMVLGLAAGVTLFVLSLAGSRMASAAAILTKSDEAIAGLVEPGRVLFRRWRIVDRIREQPGAPEQIVERYTLEWIDGSDIRHATGKSITASGRMYLAYANLLDDGGYVPRVYYEPGFADEPRGLLSTVPSRQEFEAAATRFTGSERQVVDRYLARGYIYEPIVSERRFNDAMLKPLAGSEPLPQVVLSVDDSGSLNGIPVYRVRSFESIRVPFRWSSSGPPKVWLERQETVRYIAKDTYLTLRAEETVESEAGRQLQTVRELVETRTLDAPPAGESPFDLEIPPGVPSRRQSAFEHLSQVIRTLRRTPAFLAQH